MSKHSLSGRFALASVLVLLGCTTGSAPARLPGSYSMWAFSLAGAPAVYRIPYTSRNVTTGDSSRLDSGFLRVADDSTYSLLTVTSYWYSGAAGVDSVLEQGWLLFLGYPSSTAGIRQYRRVDSSTFQTAGLLDLSPDGAVTIPDGHRFLRFRRTPYDQPGT